MFIYLLNTNGFSLSILYPVAMLMGLGNSLFWPTAQAFVQELVKKEEYFPANALLSASYQVGSLLGASIGGFIVHYYGPITALYFNGMAYVFSAVLIGLAPFKNRIINNKSENIIQSMSKGYLFLKSKVGVLFLGITTILSDIAIWGALSVLTITISKEIFLKGSWGYGLMDGMYGLGALLSKAIKKIGRRNSLLICYAIAGFSCFISPLVFSIYLAGAAYFFMGLHNNAARIIVRTLFMEIIPNNIMGRVQTIFGIYTRVMVLGSALLAGWITEEYNPVIGMNFASAHYAIALIGIIIIIKVNRFKDEIFKRNN